jgi:branched-chain amino acid transport system substrate-binding protein
LGPQLGATLGEKFQEIGWEKVGEEYFTAGETDFYSLMTKIKSSGATLVVGTANSINSQASFVKQARELNVPALIYMEAFTENGDFYNLCGEASDFVLDCRSAYMNNPDAGEAFNAKFSEKFGYNTSAANGGFIYDCFNWFLAVVEATNEKFGDVNSETLIQFGQEEIQTGNFVWTDGMVMPAIKYSAETMPEPVIGEDAYIFPILQIKEGSIQIVYPKAYKTTDLMLPDYVINNAN